MKRVRAVVTVILFSGFLLHAQEGDPAKREDAAIERQRMLKATDQVEMLTDQITKMKEELKALKQDSESLHTENYKLKQQVELNETKRLKERDIILTEVAKSIAKISKEKEKAIEKKIAEVAEKEKAQEKDKEKSKKSAKAEKGYEHVVEKGQTLWLISKAYKDKGINVSVDDIRLANNLKKNATLKVGQKLFIPQP